MEGLKQQAQQLLQEFSVLMIKIQDMFKLLHKQLPIENQETLLFYIEVLKF